jgi:GH15 family glucan-1,4-alpha-glucosidase
MSSATSPSTREPPRTAATVAGGFPDIGDYAFLADCETSALVAPSGAVEWLCLPRPDAPSVFGALLDRSAGSFRFGPENAMVPSQRRYVPGSLVLETTWQTPTGWLIVHDALVMGPWRGDGRPAKYRRPPADLVAQGVLLRTATCVEGTVPLVAHCLPLFDYGRRPATWAYAGTGWGAARTGAGDGAPAVRLTTSLRLGLVGPRAYARTTLSEGDAAFVALAWDAPGPRTTDAAFARVQDTVAAWRRWLKGGTFPDHPWRAHLERSALTLKGLTYAPTGAILAAATTSLPETPGGERNWDYRFSWLRDSAFLLRALYTLGFEREAFDYFAYLVETVGAGGDRPLVLYGIGGETDLAERRLDHLGGHRGARPVRIGNDAAGQRQHDIWGLVLDALATHARRQVSQLPAQGWALIDRLVEGALADWREPDRGIWEVRGEPRHFTASKVMCWVAADRGAALASARGDQARAERWRAGADAIRADVLAHGVDARGVLTQHYDTSALDASALLIPRMGFLPWDDERVVATVRAIADELTHHGLVLRYRVDDTDDGLAGEEGTFTICSFWLVSALAAIGDLERARALCQKLLSLSGPLLLYAEELDAASGQQLGNVPQAFTHLALIDAVTRLIAAERAAAERPPADAPRAPPAGEHWSPAG